MCTRSVSELYNRRSRSGEALAERFLGRIYRKVQVPGLRGSDQPSCCHARDQRSRGTSEAWWMCNEDEGAKVDQNRRCIRLSTVLDVDRGRDCSFRLYPRGFRVVSDNRIVLRRPEESSRRNRMRLCGR